MEDLIRWEEGSSMPIRSLQGYGHYHEQYRREDGAWRIWRSRLPRRPVVGVPFG